MADLWSEYIKIKTYDDCCKGKQKPLQCLLGCSHFSHGEINSTFTRLRCAMPRTHFSFFRDCESYLCFQQHSFLGSCTSVFFCYTGLHIILSCDKFTYFRIYALKMGTCNGGGTRDFQQMVRSPHLPLRSWPSASSSSCSSCASWILTCSWKGSGSTAPGLQELTSTGVLQQAWKPARTPPAEGQSRYLNAVDITYSRTPSTSRIYLTFYYVLILFL